MLCAPECRICDGVKGIHLTVDRLGRPSGRAFIEMEHEEDVSKALEKHRQYLGPRYVEGPSLWPNARVQLELLLLENLKKNLAHISVVIYSLFLHYL